MAILRSISLDHKDSPVSTPNRKNSPWKCLVMSGTSNQRYESVCELVDSFFFTSCAVTFSSFSGIVRLFQWLGYQALIEINPIWVHTIQSWKTWITSVELFSVDLRELLEYSRIENFVAFKSLSYFFLNQVSFIYKRIIDQ